MKMELEFYNYLDFVGRVILVNTIGALNYYTIKLSGWFIIILFLWSAIPLFKMSNKDKEKEKLRK